jgi:hypothetical protein
MELNLNGISFPVNLFDDTPLVKRSELYCEDCEEVIKEYGKMCTICGSTLLKREVSIEQENTNNARPTNNIDTQANRRLEALVEFLGPDIGDLMSNAMSLREPSRTISESFLKTLSKCIIDEKNKSILWDVRASFGPIETLLVPATFQEMKSQSIEGQCVWGQPPFGDTAKFENEEFINNKILILQRGRCSFAMKYLRAKEAGAAALIICQTLDIWPFVMTDSSDELIGLKDNGTGTDTGTGTGTGIDTDTDTDTDCPIFMMDKASGILLEKLYTKLPVRDVPKGLCITIGDQTKECSICQENFESGESVLKLMCRHVYHTDCVINWLKTKNNCPLCRKALPSLADETEKEKEANSAFNYHL